MMSAPKLTIKFETVGQIAVGTVFDANMLDAMNVADFGNQVMAYVQPKARLNLLLNFEHVDYMSSAALTELLRVNDAVRKGEGSVRLCGLSKDIRKVFQITNLEKLFVIHDGDTAAAATKRFERALALAAEDDAWATP